MKTVGELAEVHLLLKVCHVLIAPFLHSKPSLTIVWHPRSFGSLSLNVGLGNKELHVVKVDPSLSWHTFIFYFISLFCFWSEFGINWSWCQFERELVLILGFHISLAHMCTFCKLCWPPKDKCSYFLPLLSSLSKISSKQFHSHNFYPHICNDDFRIHIYLGISNVKSQIFPLELWQKEKMKYLQKLVKKQTFNDVAG